MNTVSPELYQYSVAQANENMIKSQEAGFAINMCNIVKLMYAHIMIHCVENYSLFNTTQAKSINHLINDLI